MYLHVISELAAFTVIGTFDVLTAAAMPALCSVSPYSSLIQLGGKEALTTHPYREGNSTRTSSANSFEASTPCRRV